MKRMLGVAVVVLLAALVLATASFAQPMWGGGPMYGRVGQGMGPGMMGGG